MNKNQQASPVSKGKTSKHSGNGKNKPASIGKKPSKALREAASIVGSLGGRPKKDSGISANY